MREQPLNVIWAFNDRTTDAGPPTTSKKLHIDNRKTFLKKIGMDHENLVCVEQIHEDGVAVVTKKDKGQIILGADALVTADINLSVAVFTADCLPVFLYDEARNTIAVVHTGWRGSRLSILKNTLDIMADEFGAMPEHIYACFGPAIRKCCYEVGEEFRGYFSAGLLEKEDKLLLDLIVINKQYLLNFGVRPKRIMDSNICTSCRNDEFFSYRKEGEKCGRMMSVIMMKDRN